ncbi:hypothetical protein GCM10025857_05640 [Alicyclobacillus contaminans]|uniref:YlbF family regulator n=1 Tax=Alicyclobacillus contaminans TaxID=392016 RepID=UPI0004140541|nr:YlbF family regulator [Alicyclobacillus contaminans]GMA49207.1 hypothetical protein GCM10025857_05640 [Alicyclobacillus contaminans]
MVDHNELWAETEELADMIVQAPEIVRYQRAEAQMKAHPRAQRMLERLRALREEIGEFQARKVPPKHYMHLLRDSESLLEELEKIPEVVEFQHAQTAVNDLLQTITRRLAKAVLEKVEDTDHPFAP